MNFLKTPYQLYTHQEIALSLIEAHPNFMLAMEQGTGKTLPTLARVLDDEIESVLVVCPKATMGVWTRDIEKFTPEMQRKLNDKICVINYDMVWRDPQYDREWDCIILDESHYIKSRTAKRTKFLLKLALKSTYRYCLTGTPIGNGRLEDIWTQFTFLQPMQMNRGIIGSKIFGGYYNVFLSKYCLLNKYYTPYKYMNVAELQDIIMEHSYRILKTECLDLPPKLPEEYYSVTLQEKKLYTELHKFSAIVDMDILAENPLARRAKFRQVASGFIVDNEGKLHELKTEKTKLLNEFLDAHEKKLVIFAHFKHSIRQICALLTKRKIRHVSLYGESKDKTIWRQFQSDPDLQVIVCQYQSASAGIDLYAADTMLFYEPTDSSNVYEQCKDRIHRIGTVNPCSYICFATKGTIEPAMYKALENFKDFSEKLYEEYIDTWQRSGY